jgi:circadian clock protein KaiB
VNEQAGEVTSSAGESHYVLSLFVSGLTPLSTHAITNIKRICEEKIPGHYSLEIIDIFQQPLLARAHQIIAVPTLIKYSPLPVRRLIGDMSRKEKVLGGLEME